MHTAQAGGETDEAAVGVEGQTRKDRHIESCEHGCRVLLLLVYF